MKKLFFTLLAVTALSCSSSDDNNPTVVEPNIRLQKMEVRNSSGALSYTTEYTYENDHLSKSTKLNSDGSVDSSITYSYTDDQLIKVTYFNNKGNVTSTNSFVYDDNKIVSANYSNGHGEQYIYNDLGQVIKLQWRLLDGTISDVANYEYDTAGNLVKATSVSTNSSSYFTFDDKKTVASLLYPEAVLKIYEYGVPGSNNVIKARYVSGAIHDYEYEYNAAGYPTKKIDKKETGTVREETTYFYSN